MCKEEFKTYVLNLAKEIGVAGKVKDIQLREMKRKIASCSSRGRLTFDPSIIEKPKEEMDFIIFHELLHLRYPNHGKMFKKLLLIYLKKSN